MSMDTDTVSPSEELKDDALNQIDEAIAALEAARKLIPAAVRHLADAEGLTSLIAGYARQAHRRSARRELDRALPSLIAIRARDEMEPVTPRRAGRVNKSAFDKAAREMAVSCADEEAAGHEGPQPCDGYEPDRPGTAVQTAAIFSGSWVSPTIG